MPFSTPAKPEPCQAGAIIALGCGTSAPAVACEQFMTSVHMSSASRGIRTSADFFHARAISGSGNRRLAIAYASMRATRTQFDPLFGVTMSGRSYRPLMTARYGLELGDGQLHCSAERTRSVCRERSLDPRPAICAFLRLGWRTASIHRTYSQLISMGNHAG
jgi:hypothetical protein